MTLPKNIKGINKNENKKTGRGWRSHGDLHYDTIFGESWSFRGTTYSSFQTRWRWHWFDGTQWSLAEENKIHVCWGLNSHCLPMIGTVINLIVGVYIPIIRVPIKGGMTIPNTFDHGTCVFFVFLSVPRRKKRRQAKQRGIWGLGTSSFMLKSTGWRG